jgi:hypothetical protein
MATENKLMTLNFAASLLGPNEVHLEAGSWKGLSIIGAMMGNDDRHFYAIDDFFSSRIEARVSIECSTIRVFRKAEFYRRDCFEIFSHKV